MSGESGHRISPAKPEAVMSEILAFRKVVALSLAALLCIVFAPALLRAQGAGLTPGPGGSAGVLDDTSGAETEEAVQPSGMEEEGIGALIETLIDEPVELSPGREEFLGGVPSAGEAVEPSAGEIEEAVQLSGAEGEEEFELPPIEWSDLAELYDLSPVEVERPIFAARPQDPFYWEVVSGAPKPDVTLLGPLPERLEEGVEFTDVAADWIYHQKSAGLTELRGHVMVVYDTTIISSDEATLNELDEIYRFFGEGRVFVDDADFTLECDELEIHDADEEKMIYIRGPSTLVVFADDDAKEPGEDSSRRERLEYALKQNDTTITFTDAEYDYENDIFDAHGGVRFEQPGKYAKGGEFHGEDETDYMLFTGDCEFWQEDGQWLYQYEIVEDQEDPPSRRDRITRALLSVPSTITSDEAEAKGEDGWLQLRSYSGNVVYFHQTDKHAECRTFTLWYTEEEKKEEGEEAGEEGPVEPEKAPSPKIPPGIGSPRLASDFPPGYVPWKAAAEALEAVAGGVDELPASAEQPRVEEEPEQAIDRLAFRERAEQMRRRLAGEPDEEPAPEEDVGEEDDIATDGETIADAAGMEPEQSPIAESVESDEGVRGPVDLLGEEPVAEEPSNGQEFEFEFPAGETMPPSGAVGSIAELGERVEEVRAEPTEEEEEAPQDQLLMEGDVFFRQENGDWLFEYDVVREEEESEDAVEQYRKWANGSCDVFHVWMDDEIVEATGSVFGEQENQRGSCDFLRYIGELDMMYVRGNVDVQREDKHKLLSEEGFIFFTTNIFEALGAVQTTVMVDVEERRTQAQEGTSEEEETTEE